MARVGNSSSKYDYDPEQFDRDYEDKTSLLNLFKDELKAVIYKNYKYSDKTSIRKKAKKEAITKVVYDYFMED